MPDNNDYDMDPPKVAGGPWGNGGGGGNDDGGSPWNRPSGGGGGGQGSGGGGPDLEEQMKRMQEKFRSRRRGGRGKGGGGKGGGGFGKGGFVFLAAAAFVAWLATGVVIVDAGEQATVFRFGKFQTNFQSGLNFHFPQPIESHVIVKAEERQEIKIGQNEDESLMLTSNEDIVSIKFSVFWKVRTAAPQDYVLNVKQPDAAVRLVGESVMREVVGKSILSEIITLNRASMQLSVRDQMQAILDDYDTGVDILEVTIVDAELPRPVIPAFDDVTTAEQDAERVEREANTFAEQVVPEARGTAERLLREAEGYRDQVIADANGEAQRFNQIYAEYIKAPRVTRERMFLEALEEVLGKSEKTILDSESGAVPYLPLDRVNRSGGQ